MEPTRLSLTEYAVLGVLAGGPSHGFAVAKQLAADGEVGRVLTVRRPLVYRAMDRLVESGLVESLRSEPGRAGPQRVIHRVTSEGRHLLGAWLDEPVHHIRDMRIEFLLKVELLSRSGRSPLTLIRHQRAALDPTLAALEEAASRDPVEVWRRHNAAAAAAFLDDLESMLAGV